MKRYVRALPVLLLLAGCRAQPPAPTPTPEPTPVPEVSGAPEAASVGIEVDIGDGAHTFWVELAEAEVGKTVNIYREKGDPKPLQSFTDEEALLDLEMAELTAEDVNFDSYMDFHYCTSTGYALVSHSSYYVWDPNTEQFQADPYGLNKLSAAEFLPYSGEISSLSQGPMGRLITSYQYEGDNLSQVEECFFPETVSAERAYEARYVTVDDTHTFWVKLVDTGCFVDTGYFGPFEIQIFSEKDDAQPLQTLEGSCEPGFQYLRWFTTDMDFDGDEDFAILFSEAPNGHAAFSYYIWEEAEERFVPDPYGLNKLFSVGTPEMYPEEKMIRTFLRWRAGGEGETRLYRYLEEGFTCVRYMSWQWHEETDEQVESIDFFVENYEGGEMKTVYKETHAVESLNGYLWSEEFSKWYDPAYHGE